MAWGHTLPTTSGSPFSPSQTTKKVSVTPRFLMSVSTAIQNRADRLKSGVAAELQERRNADLSNVDAIFENFRSTLESTLDVAEEARRAGEEALFQLPEEKKQRDTDLARVRTRLSHLDDELHAERDAVERRYRDVQPHTFVAALVFALTPEDAEKLESAGAR